MRVLIAKDEVTIANFIRQGLTGARYAVDVAYDGPDGLAHALATDYDLLVLDTMLPQMDGLELLATLRRRRVKTPTLLLTARDAVDSRVPALMLGPTTTW